MDTIGVDLHKQQFCSQLCRGNDLGGRLPLFGGAASSRGLRPRSGRSIPKISPAAHPTGTPPGRDRVPAG
jgi:hypothetical protein